MDYSITIGGSLLFLAIVSGCYYFIKTYLTKKYVKQSG